MLLMTPEAFGYQYLLGISRVDGDFVPDDAAGPNNQFLPKIFFVDFV